MLVVTKGPVAIAGSTSSRCNNRGTKDPKAVAISIDPAIPSPTTKPRYGEISTNCIMANNPNINPYKIPRIIPTRISFKMIVKLFKLNPKYILISYTPFHNKKKIMHQSRFSNYQLFFQFSSDYY